MEKFVKGDVVVIPFPFSDLTASKKRPALVVAKPIGQDLILAQITSKINLNAFSVRLANGFETGKLPVESFVKVNRLFTADKSIVGYIAGHLKQRKIQEVESSLIRLFKE